jgi:hypothetical protein
VVERERQARYHPTLQTYNPYRWHQRILHNTNCSSLLGGCLPYRTGLIFFILGYYLIYDSIEGG